MTGLDVLEVLAGRDVGATFALTDGAARIGRDPAESDVVLTDPRVSRRHCRVWVEGGLLMLDDAGSTAGTQVNGTAISRATALRRGDRITLGATELQVLWVPQAAATMIGEIPADLLAAAPPPPPPPPPAAAPPPPPPPPPVVADRSEPGPSAPDGDEEPVAAEAAPSGAHVADAPPAEPEAQADAPEPTPEPQPEPAADLEVEPAPEPQAAPDPEPVLERHVPQVHDGGTSEPTGSEAVSEPPAEPVSDAWPAAPAPPPAPSSDPAGLVSEIAVPPPPPPPPPPAAGETSLASPVPPPPPPPDGASAGAVPPPPPPPPAAHAPEVSPQWQPPPGPEKKGFFRKLRGG